MSTRTSAGGVPRTVHARIARCARRLALLLISCVVCLALLEVSLRVFGIEPRALPYHSNLGHAVLGMKPEASKRIVGGFEEYAGQLVMSTNNMAFYEELDTPLQAAPNTRRIAVVGDSFVVGACSTSESFPNQLESMLALADASRGHEVLNAGVGRYSPYQYLLRAEHEILALHPDQLLVALYVGNDFLDIIRQDDRPYLTLAADGSIETHAPYFITYEDPQSLPAWYESSRVWNFARNALGPTLLYQISRVRLLYRNLKAADRGPFEIARYMLEVKQLDRISHGLMAQSLHQYVWFQRFPETLDDALRFNRHVIAEFARICEREHVALTYVIVPSKPVIEGERLRELFDGLAAHDPRLSAESLIAFENGLADQTLAACAEQGVAAIDLRPGLARSAAGELLYYPLDMHLNVAGNRAVAMLLTEALAQGSQPR